MEFINFMLTHKLRNLFDAMKSKVLIETLIETSDDVVIVMVMKNPNCFFDDSMTKVPR